MHEPAQRGDRARSDPEEDVDPRLSGNLLLRKGALGTRDGAWLLRVERESYDVVLDRFSWGWSWVNLPWMEAPLRVEW